MTTVSSSSAAIAASDSTPGGLFARGNRRLRATYRLGRVACHLLNGVLTIALVYPFVRAPIRLSLKQAWSHNLLTMLGVRLRLDPSSIAAAPAAADMARRPVGLLVANHISFLDIFVINAWAPTAFVSKDDVLNWPVIGWLCRHTDTIFLQRGSRRAAQAARDQLVGCLRAGGLAAVFPEGTTSDGEKVLPFHSALLQSAIDANAPVTPLVLRYCAPNGRPDHAADYVGETTLLACLWSIAMSDGLIARLAPLPPLASLAGAATDRRHLAAHAHRAIAHQLARWVSPNPAAQPAARTAVEIPADPPAARR